MSDETLVQFTLGDSRPYTVIPKIDGLPFAIDPVTSVVKAAIVKNDRKARLTEDLELHATTPGSDWAVSKCVVKFPRSHTQEITVTGKALLELQVTFKSSDPLIEDDDWTWFFPIELIRGHII